MRIANHDGRAVLLLSEEKGADLATASAGRFGPDLSSIHDAWHDLVAWAPSGSLTADVTIAKDRLGSPSPYPSQVAGTPDGVGLGMNPGRFLQPGETPRTWVEGIGGMEHVFR